MHLPVPPKTEVAEEQRSEASLEELARPAEVCATQIADSKTVESTDLFSISSDLAGSRPRRASCICADSFTLEVEQGEEEGADQAIRAPHRQPVSPLPLPAARPPLRALPSHSLLSLLAPLRSVPGGLSPAPAFPQADIFTAEADTAGSSLWPLLMGALVGCLGVSVVALKWRGYKMDGQKRSRHPRRTREWH